MKGFHAQALDKWYEILTIAGVDENILDGRHHPCPICGGKDRFRWDNKNGLGSYICNQCGAGDGIKLLQKIFGLNFPETLERIDTIIDKCHTIPKLQKPVIDPKIALNAVWGNSTPLTGTDPASNYLASRKISTLPGSPHNVRYCENCYHSELKTGISALVAKITNIQNKPVSIQRIYLTRTGAKRDDVQDIKKMMPATEELKGSAVRLFLPLGTEFNKTIPGLDLNGNMLGIAEGIETAIATTLLFNVATWACLSSTLMKSWTVPKEYSLTTKNTPMNIVIFGDNDKNFCGQEAAYTLAKKLHNEEYPVAVKIPPKPGQDWLDYLHEHPGKQLFY